MLLISSVLFLAWSGTEALLNTEEFDFQFEPDKKITPQEGEHWIGCHMHLNTDTQLDLNNEEERACCDAILMYSKPRRGEWNKCKSQYPGHRLMNRIFNDTDNHKMVMQACPMCASEKNGIFKVPILNKTDLGEYHQPKGGIQTDSHARSLMKTKSSVVARQTLLKNLDWSDGVKDDTYNVPNTAGNGRVVYIVDTGLNCFHEEYNSPANPGNVRCQKGWDYWFAYVGSTSICRTRSIRCAVDKHGHGTHCGATAVGANVGIASYASAVGIKVLDGNGQGTGGSVLGGMQYVRTHVAENSYGNMAVMSMSLGGQGNSNNHQSVINTALTENIVTVVAAGNQDSDACYYTPAYVPNAITVGSTRDIGSTTFVSKSSFSNWGNCVTIHAIGSNVISASHHSKLGRAQMSGTSMACPAVAGAVAVILSHQPDAQTALSRLTTYGIDNIIQDLTAGTVNLHMRVRDTML